MGAPNYRLRPTTEELHDLAEAFAPQCPTIRTIISELLRLRRKDKNETNRKGNE